MTDERLDENTVNTPDHSTDAADATAHSAPASAGAPPQYGVGPFSVREVALLAVWLVAFIVSFFSLYRDELIGDVGGIGGSVWNSGLDWILTIGVPTVAVFLVVLRRFSPDGIRRVGSLGIDQFASVAFSVSAVVWLAALWTNVVRGVQTDVWLSSWVVWVEFFLMLAGVVLTVFAPLLPTLSEDFKYRREIPAHRNARPLRPVVARPAPERPAPAADTAQPADAASGTAGAHAAGGYGTDAYGAGAYGAGAAADTAAAGTNARDTGAYDTDAFGENPDVERSLDDQPLAAADETPAESDAEAEWAAAVVVEEPVVVSGGPVSQAFWALVPVERDVVDAQGAPLFRIGPDAWALVIEDRGEVFVVRHEDGRVGYLHDVSDVTRG
ncbi:hypothetical protein QNO21_04895 [Microbacterium sp. zg-Y818]|uniref:hypothetical protein n=1 Tax=unclassified Microbacterium TaxID=2609290 RepID=UPI00214CF388|nr:MULTISPECIES: hypothetical protein [unclassified Microbacterium]MCR2800648.1 hypothetical protein [Microbacterium sp. zg.Y818]WIM23374.1 hypothetical protein QNO21_04895 [Microbacterium sp. zg-Y818]